MIFNLDYEKITLEGIDSYQHYIFECDGDTKTIEAKVRDNE